MAVLAFGQIPTNMAFNELDNTERLLLLEISDSGQTSHAIHWYNPDRKQLVLASKHLQDGETQQYSWLPEESMWTGDLLVYGHRLFGYFSLDADGTRTHLTEQYRSGKISRSGEQALRFTDCGEDGKLTGLVIAPLDGEERPLICRDRYVDEKTPWYGIDPIWNPYLAQAHFILTTKYGRSNSLRKESVDVYRFNDDGSLTNIISLNTDFPVHATSYFQARPDGNALAIRNQKDSVELYDWDGNMLGVVDLTHYKQLATEAGLQESWSPFHTMAWSPDSQMLAIAVNNCQVRRDNNGCATSLLLTDALFNESHEATIIPNTGFIREMAWSPDGAFVALLGAGIVNDRLKKDVIFIVDINSGKVEQYVFESTQFIKKMVWVR